MEKTVDETEFASISGISRVAHIPIALSFRQTSQFVCVVFIHPEKMRDVFFSPVVWGRQCLLIGPVGPSHRLSLDWNISKTTGWIKTQFSTAVNSRFLIHKRFLQGLWVVWVTYTSKHLPDGSLLVPTLFVLITLWSIPLHSSTTLRFTSGILPSNSRTSVKPYCLRHYQNVHLSSTLMTKCHPMTCSIICSSSSCSPLIGMLRCQTEMCHYLNVRPAGQQGKPELAAPRNSALLLL